MFVSSGIIQGEAVVIEKCAVGSVFPPWKSAGFDRILFTLYLFGPDKWTEGERELCGKMKIEGDWGCCFCANQKWNSSLWCKTLTRVTPPCISRWGFVSALILWIEEKHLKRFQTALDSNFKSILFWCCVLIIILFPQCVQKPAMLDRQKYNNIRHPYTSVL